MVVWRERSWTVQGVNIRIELFTTLGVLAASVLGVLGVHLSPLSADILRTLDVWALADPSILYLGLLVVPAVYLSVVSTERFRWESLASLVVLPGATMGDAIALGALMVPLLVVLSSYKARSVFNGKNYFWTYFGTGGTLIVVLSLALAGASAYTVYTDEAVQTEMEDAVTEQAVEMATAIAERQVMAEMAGDDAIAESMNPALFILQEMSGPLMQYLSADVVHEGQDYVIQATEDSGLDNEQTQFVMMQFGEARNLVLSEGDRYAEELPQRYADQHQDDSIDEERLDDTLQDLSQEYGEDAAAIIQDTIMDAVSDADGFTDADEAALRDALEGLDEVTVVAAQGAVSPAIDGVMEQLDAIDGAESIDDIQTPAEMIEQEIAAMIQEPVADAFAHPERVAAVLFFFVFTTVRLLKLPIGIVAGITGWGMHLVRKRL